MMEVKEEETKEKEEEVKEKEEEEEEEEEGKEEEEEKAEAGAPQPVALLRTQRRRSTVPIVPPIITTPPPQPVEDLEEEGDEDEEETKFEAKNISSEGHNAEDVIEGGEVKELTNQELEKVFSTCDHGVVKGQLNPMLFGTLIRTITGNKNLYEEMKYFQFFNTSGDGVIDLEEWLDGVERMKNKDNGLKTVFYRGLVKYHNSNSFVL